MPLRTYQQQCLDKSLERYRAGVNRQLAVLATGTGKTCIAANLRSHHEFSRKILFLVHREELADQAADDMLEWNPGLMVGVEMANRRSRPMDTFVIASVPTIGKRGSPRLTKFDPSDFDCIIQDEVHHGVAATFKNVYSHFGLMAPNPTGPLFLGLTATPNRSDGQGLRLIMDEIIFEYGMEKAINNGYLVDLRVWDIVTKTNLDCVGTSKGELLKKELEHAVNTPERNGMIVKAWLRYAKNKKTLSFTVDVQHALDQAEAFKALGVSAAAVWGEDPERGSKRTKLRNGELDVVCNCAVWTEGFDERGIECVILGKPTKSTLALEQMMGRGLRLPDGCNHISEVGEHGKRECIFLSVVDPTSLHKICTPPSLLGLPEHLDLKGSTYREAKGKIERVAAEFPTANLADLRDLDKLAYIAKQIDLFTVKYPPEVERLTELAWRKQGDGYILPVMRDRLTLCRDLRDEWWVRGTLKGRLIEIHAQNLAGAFNCADREVQGCASEAVGLVKRNARWHDQRPSEKQVGLCRKLGLAIPAGATRGMVSAALDNHFGRA